jgi:hypothetical protein
MASMVLYHPDNEIILTIEQLEKLVEELKEWLKNLNHCLNHMRYTQFQT